MSYSPGSPKPTCLQQGGGSHVEDPDAAGSDVTAVNSSSIPTGGGFGVGDGSSSGETTITWQGISAPGTSASRTYLIPANSTFQLIYTAEFDPNAPYPAPYENSATGKIGNTTIGPASAVVNIGGVPSYTITKNVTNVGGEGALGSVNEAGDVIEYQIVVTNTGSQDLTGVVVTDPLLTSLSAPNKSSTSIIFST